MSRLRDYIAWHEAYDDPGSDLSWRLTVVQGYLRVALDARTGPIRVLSACAGDGRDVLGVLADRPDSHRVEVSLIELQPDLAQRARDAAAAAGLRDIRVIEADAGITTTYSELVPAHIVLLMGIFGNISDEDLERTVRAAPQLCGPHATVLWSRGRHDNDRNDAVRSWFTDVGFTELDYATLETGQRPALGAMRYDGPPQPLVADRRLFTFVR